MMEEEKYHLIIKEYKKYAVSIQSYELAAHLRDIETTFFNVSLPNVPTTIHNYIGFNKDLLINHLSLLPLKVKGSEFIIRDIKLRELLD